MSNIRFCFGCFILGKKRRRRYTKLFKVINFRQRKTSLDNFKAHRQTGMDFVCLFVGIESWHEQCLCFVLLMREGFLFHEIVARQIMASTKRRGKPKRKEKRAKSRVDHVVNFLVTREHTEQRERVCGMIIKLRLKDKSARFLLSILLFYAVWKYMQMAWARCRCDIANNHFRTLCTAWAQKCALPLAVHYSLCKKSQHTHCLWTDQR